MKRLGGKQPKRKQIGNMKARLLADATKLIAEKDSFSNGQIEKISEIAGKLLSSGYIGVYEDSREKIRLLAEQLERKIPQKSRYFYKWAEDGEIFGPFSADDMNSWRTQGFFVSTPIWLKKNDGIFESSVNPPEFS